MLEEQHLERGHFGERWALAQQEILSAVAVKETHILNDFVSVLVWLDCLEQCRRK